MDFIMYLVLQLMIIIYDEKIQAGNITNKLHSEIKLQCTVFINMSGYHSSFNPLACIIQYYSANLMEK